MSGRLLVSGFVVVLVLVFGNAAGARVNAFPTDGLLVFSCDCAESDGSTWLFTIAPDGRGLRMLPRTYGSSYPRWSRDGRTIAFARGFRPAKSIWLYSVAESKPRRLTHPLGGTSDDTPAWSPRADVLAFVRARPEERSSASLRTRVIRSGNSAVLHSGASTLFQPDWSPDGRRIAGIRTGGELWEVNADGSDLRRLAPRRISGELPRWSPDGTRVAFLFPPILDQASFSVRVLNLRSGRVRTVFKPDNGTHQVGSPAEGLAWSPDGRWLAVLRTVDEECIDYDPTNERCEQTEIWIVNTTDNRTRHIFTTGRQGSEGYGLDWRPRQ